MPFAVTLRIDQPNATAIEQMWDALAAHGIDNDRAQLKYAPHITLAIYPDDVAEQRLHSAVAAAATRWKKLPISLAGLAIFPGPTSILWIAPIVTTALLECHADWHAAEPDLPAHPHYRAGAWVPHITLSGPLHDPGPALSVLTPLWHPRAARLDQIDLVRFRPVEVLRSHIIFS